VTGVTTLLVLVALFLFGGVVIHDFAFALLVGVLIGTYSSIFVASPILHAWRSRAPRPIRDAAPDRRRGQERARS